MHNHIFHMVDVFAEKKYCGNQLAVVRDAGDLDGQTMQQIAREINFSETTFITGGRIQDKTFDVRIFTPEEEVPFAGHPTLGTAFVIRSELLKRPVDELYLNLKVGKIPVSFEERDQENELLWMTQKTPTFGQQFEPEVIADILSIGAEQIDTRFPVQEVSTGLPFIIVPLKNLPVVRQSFIERNKFFRLIENTSAKAILVFSPECYDLQNNLNVRVFVDYFGIPEDPATGSANGCLAGYLVQYSYFGDSPIDIRIEQGMEIGRPSLIYAKAVESDAGIKIQIGGKVFSVARGELL